MILRIFPVLLGLALLLPGGAAGQTLVLDLRGGVSVPAGSLRTAFTPPPGGGELEADAGVGLHFALRRSAHHGIYLGFSQLRFDCGTPGCPGPGSLVATSWDAGIHLYLRRGGWEPWLRLGTVVAHTERPSGIVDPGVGDPGTDVETRRSDVGIGGEAGAGVRIPVWGAVSLSPGVRYTLVNSRIDDDTLLRLRYWVADVGLVVGF